MSLFGKLFDNKDIIITILSKKHWLSQSGVIELIESD